MPGRQDSKGRESDGEFWGKDAREEQEKTRSKATATKDGTTESPVQYYQMNCGYWGYFEDRLTEIGSVGEAKEAVWRRRSFTARSR
jgi:hypothetical protein